jgi:hypothetical protein
VVLLGLDWRPPPRHACSAPRRSQLRSNHQKVASWFQLVNNWEPGRIDIGMPADARSLDAMPGNDLDRRAAATTRRPPDNSVSRRITPGGQDALSTPYARPVACPHLTVPGIASHRSASLLASASRLSRSASFGTSLSASASSRAITAWNRSPGSAVPGMCWPRAYRRTFSAAVVARGYWAWLS